MKCKKVLYVIINILYAFYMKMKMSWIYFPSKLEKKKLECKYSSTIKIISLRLKTDLMRSRLHTLSAQNPLGRMKTKD